MIGGGIVGLTTSYYLSLDPRVNVTLLEKNKAVLMESSGQDASLFMRNMPTLRTICGQPRGTLNSLTRVDGNNSVYLTHMLKEPGVTKFIWHWMIQRSPNTLKINELTEKSY